MQDAFGHHRICAERTAFAVGPTPFLSITIGGIGVTLSSCKGPTTLGRAAG